ncbi:hypothetical protein DFJ74DRAFT_258781 [Hyaloraphidium curvatum]|nr:hypothetical protein DFJ74DRAFT_258781 [Hyaloraphidium curvatum]
MASLLAARSLRSLIALADKGDAKGAEKLLDTLEALAAEAKGADRAEWTRHAIKAAAAVAGPDAAVRMLREALREAAVAKDGDAGNPGVDRDWVFSLALSALRRGKPDTATALLDAALKSRVRFRLPKPAVDQLARFGPAKGDDKTRWWLREWARLRNKPGAAEILRGPPTPDAPARVRFAHAARNGDPAAAEHFAAACADPLAQPYQIGSLLRVAARHAPLDTIREMRPHLAALPEGKHPGGDAVLKAASAALGSGRRQEAEEVLMMAAGQLHRHEDVLPAPGVEEGEAAARAWAGRAAETLAWTAGAPGSGVEFGHGGQRFSWN